MIWGANAKDKADPIRIEKAFPAIISKAKSQRVNSLMRSRAPKIAHPRRVGSTYLLSGLVKCHKCNRALSGQDAKSGQFSYYVCQSIMKRGKDACDSPRLNARRFEEMVVGNVLLAKADIPYEKLKEMDEINPTFRQTDLVLVISANNVVNPLAREADPSIPIAGMPILDVDQARAVVVVKRSLSPAFAGIPNPLFAADNTLMLFGDAKRMLQELTTSLSNAHA